MIRNTSSKPRLSLFRVPALAALAALAACSAPTSPSEGVASTGSAATVSPNQTAFDFFLSEGLTNDQAAGIVGNLDQESSMDPTIAQYGGGPGRGIAQWSVGGRWDTYANDNVLWYASVTGQSPWSLQLQLEFIWYELKTFPGDGLSALQASTTVSAATIAFQDDYEECGTCDTPNRIALAQSAYDDYAVISVPPPVPVEVGLARAGGTAGWWDVTNVGKVTAHDGAASHGDASALHLVKPIVGIASTADGQGYWLTAADGGVFSYGDARFEGSMGGVALSAPVVGIASTPGQGYWLVAADGGVFTFGDAKFYGSMGGEHLDKPVVGIAGTPDGAGYWLVASDGGIFNFGDAKFHGSMGGKTLNKPVVGIAATSDGAGYWLVASDGGIFNFGDAKFEGSLGGESLSSPIVGIIGAPASTAGYLLDAANGTSSTFDY